MPAQRPWQLGGQVLEGALTGAGLARARDPRECFGVSPGRAGAWHLGPVVFLCVPESAPQRGLVRAPGLQW